MISVSKKIIIQEIKEKKFYTVRDISKGLDVNIKTVYKWFQLNKLQYFSISEKKTVITYSQFNEFLKQRAAIL